MTRISLHNPQHSSSLLREANRMRLAGTLCDVIIRVESREFHAHSLVLACVSRTFEALFQSRSVCYTLDFLASRTFERILEYSYTDSLEAPSEELGDLLQAASALAMEGLEKQILAATAHSEQAGGSGNEERDPTQTSEDGQVEMDRGSVPLMPGCRGQSERVKGVATEKDGPSKMELAVPETGPAGVQLSSADFAEGRTALVPESLEGVGTSARAGDLPTRGTVISGPSRPAPCHLIPPVRWPRFEAPIRPLAALPRLDSSCFPALPGTCSPLSQAPAAFSANLDFSSYARPALQGSSQLDVQDRLREDGNRMAPTFEERGNLLLKAESTTAPQRVTEMVNCFRCEHCWRRFADSLHLRMHLLSHTGDASAPVYLLCGKGYENRYALREGIAGRADAWSYRCWECHCLFPSVTAFKRHLKTHSGRPPHQCQFCRSRFQDENSLKHHKQSHQGEKPYQCSNCKKKFSLKHQLETHYRVHTGEKPFECKLCHQRSRDYSAMIKHLRTHSGALPYRCTLCQEFCPSLVAMQKHIKSHKAEEIPSDWSLEETYLYLCYV